MTGRTVAIVQSSYIPWRGYFSLIASSDVFVFLDSVQFTRRDWRSRNRIKAPQGALWLTVPLQQKGQYQAPIDAMRTTGSEWAAKHLASLRSAYGRATAFDAVWPIVAGAYADCKGMASLTEVNLHLIGRVCAALGVETRCVRDVDIMAREELDSLDPTDRLARLVEAAGGKRYLSGPSAKSYLDEAAFLAKGLTVDWADYSGLPSYPQLWGAFDPSLSILDALFNLGPALARESLGGRL